MKKIILLSLFLGLAVFYGYSQTYYYKCVAFVDKDGVRSKSKGGMYITFVNNRNACYRSDNKGYKEVILGKSAATYHYRKEQNKTLVYQEYFQHGNYSTYQPRYYYFSSDFSEMHSYYAQDHNGLNAFTYEYVRANPQDEYDDKIPIF